MITIAGVELPLNETKNPYIPTSNQQIVGYEDVLANLAYGAKKNLPVLMVGETGVGKTALVRFLAKETHNGFRRLNLNGQTTVDEFVGKMLLNAKGTYWQDGVLIDAMRNGYWLLLDEINAALPEILFALHSLMDDDSYVVLSEKDGEIVRPHPNFRLFATMNPSGRYAGTKELNKAMLSRFPIVMNLDYPSEVKEVEIIQLYSKIAKEEAMGLARMAKQIREAYVKDDIDYSCSTRDLINCAVMSEDIGLHNALDLAIVNRAGADDRKAVANVVKLLFGEKGKAKEIIDYEAEYLKVKKNLKDDALKVEQFCQDIINHATLTLSEVKDMRVNPLLNAPTEARLESLIVIAQEVSKKVVTK